MIFKHNGSFKTGMLYNQQGSAEEFFGLYKLIFRVLY